MKQKEQKINTSVLVKTEQKKSTKTTKKLKAVGTKKYIDSETGEVETMNIVSMEDRDFNFEKIWLGHLFEALNSIGNQKIAVVMWMLKNKNNENIILANQRMISKLSGVGLSTVNSTIKELKSVDFLNEVEGVTGAYQINPDVVFKGSNSKRMNVLLQYTKTSQKEIQIGENPDTFLIEDKE